MLLAAALGTLVGLVLALTGAGGAILAVPLLIFALGWDVTAAAPVAALAVSAAATAGALLGLKAGIVRYRAALLMAAAGAAMAPLGLYLAGQLPPKPLALLFAAVLATVALRMFLQARREALGLASETLQDAAACKLSSETGRFRWTALCTRALTQAGLFTGLLSGALGVGGGFVIVPALRRATDLPMQSIVATTLMVVALVSASTVATAALAGQLRVDTALPFTAGAVVAMLAGRPLASRLAGPRLQQGFAVFAGLVAFGLAVRQLV